MSSGISVARNSGSTEMSDILNYPFPVIWRKNTVSNHQAGSDSIDEFNVVSRKKCTDID
jgi:hypothetical protein